MASRFFNTELRSKAKLHWGLLSIAVATWLTLRIPTLRDVYHQDEYKWALNLESFGPESLPHPPIVPIIFKSFGELFGFQNLRFVVILFSFAMYLLQVAIVRKQINLGSAIIFAFLLAINPYAVIMSTQVDIDGTFLPLIQTLFIYFFLRWQKEKTKSNEFLLMFMVILGFLTKLSFILLVIVLLLSVYLIQEYKYLRNVTLKLVFFSILVIVTVRTLFPYSTSYVGNFLSVSFFDRSWGQSFILLSKAIILIGPLMLVFLIPEVWKSNLSKLVLIWTSANLAWYLLLFDFSERAIDRYLEALTIPVILCFSYWINNLVKNSQIRTLLTLLVVLIPPTIFLLINSLDYDTMPLHPKALYVERLLNLDLNFLFPVFTASGPLGYFVPFNFLTIIFAISLFLCFLIAFLPKKFAFPQLFIVLVLIYSMVLSSEGSFGKLYGSSSDVVTKILNKVERHQKVLTYNDIAAFELNRKNSYFGRLYMRPDWQESKKEIMRTFDGHFLYVNMPPIESAEWLFDELKRCPVVFETSSRRIFGKIYDCSLVP